MKYSDRNKCCNVTQKQGTIQHRIIFLEREKIRLAEISFETGKS